MPPTTPAASPLGDPREITNLGFARRFIEAHGDELRFVSQWRSWLRFVDKRWCQVGDESARELALVFADNCWGDLLTLPAQRRKDYMRVITYLCSARGADALLRTAAPWLAIDYTDLNADPWLLAVPNGVVDLRLETAERHREGSPDDLITERAGVEYDPDAACPRWEAFMSDVMEGDDDMVEFVRRCAGATLPGVAVQHIVFLHGNGRNGKGVTAEVLLAVLGSYGHAAPHDLLLADATDTHPARIAALYGKRMLLTDEVPGGRMNTPLLKVLSGGNTLSARRMRENPWSFAPTHLTWMTSNHLPAISDQTDSVWERMLQVPYKRFFTEAERVLGLTETLLTEEGPGILNWMLEGCFEWQRRGHRIDPPDGVREAVADYRAASDWMGDFMSDCFTAVDGAYVYCQDAFDAYRGWADSQGMRRTVTQRALTRMLRERGFDHATQVGPGRKGGFTGQQLRGDRPLSSPF